MKLVGEIFQSIYLPDGGQICLLGNPLGVPIYLSNHNLYRLDKNEDVVWQVQRQEKPGWAWFTQYRKEAEASNDSGPAGVGYSCFISIWLQYADGSNNMKEGSAPKTMDWSPGCKVLAYTLGYTSIDYEIDIETGIATTVLEEMVGRPW